MKYFLLVLGCQMNISDSERLDTVFANMGMKRCENEDEADVLGVVACSVRQKAIDKVYSRIHRWNQWKQKRAIITFVTGCILPEDKKKFLKTFDLVFPASEMINLPGMIQNCGVVTPTALQSSGKQEDLWAIQPFHRSSYEAFVPIQNGCDKFCTYCAVPYTRGRELSRPSQEIIKEVKTLIQQGFKSITLLGQNVNSYGLDKKGKEMGFPELLETIGAMGGQEKNDFWLYFTSPHPRDMTRDVLETVARHPCLAKQIHLPLQSGDNEILKKMNRKHSLEDYRIIVQNIRHLIPEATLFTDIIVGFTGEEEIHFENTRRAMEEFQYNMAYIAAYSPRPGAVSAKWQDTVSMKVKKERLHILSEIFSRSAEAWNRKLKGKTVKVLVTGRSRDGKSHRALTEGKINIHFTGGENIHPGDFVPVLITGNTGISLTGEAAPNF